jgi:hypothetical protein
MYRHPAARVAICVAAMCAGGCSLVLDFSDRQDAGFANPRCEILEPNETADTATPLAQGTNALAFCGDSDVDFFSLQVLADQDVVIATTSDAGLELELALLLGAATVQVSDAPGAAELIERTEALGNQLDPGDYRVRVQTIPPGQEGDYDLVLMSEVDASLDAGVDGS